MLIIVDEYQYKERHSAWHRILVGKLFKWGDRWILGRRLMGCSNLVGQLITRAAST